nr:hypothetical protein [Tanacetum cinerariifolium]
TPVRVIRKVHGNGRSNEVFVYDGLYSVIDFSQKRGPVTTKEKAQKKNDVKARSMLLMALLNEYLMTFNQYKDAKSLFAAIQTRFSGTEATKKTQKTLLNSRRTVNMEDTSSNAMVAIDGAGFDWIFRTDDEVPTNMALMAFSDSKLHNDKTWLFLPLKLDLSNSGLKEFKQHEFERYGPKSCEIESTNASAYIPSELKEYPDASLIKDRVSDNKDCSVKSPVVVEKKNVVPTLAEVEFIIPKQQEKPGKSESSKKEDQGYVDSGCSRHMTGNMSHLFEFKEFNGGYLTIGGGAKGGRIIGKGTLKIEIENLVDKKVNIIRCANGTEFKNSVMNDFCAMKGIRREFSVARTPQQNGVYKRRSRTLIEAARTIKAFEVYNLRTRKIEDNLHISFLEDKPSIASNGPKWLFDIDVLKKSMNYVPVVADGLLFDSSSKNANNDEPQPFSDAAHKDDEGVSKESEIDNQEKPENSTQDVNTIGSSINTANTNVNTEVWTLVDFPYGKRAIGTKWIYRNKKDERGIVVRNKAKVHLYGKIEEEVYVYQPPGFEDPEFPNRVYKVEKALYGLHQAPKAWYETLSTYLLDNRFQRGLRVISQDKYVDEILKKFGFSTVKTACTPMEISKPLLKDVEAKDVDVHLYRSMIGSLMYLIALRPDIMFVYPKNSPFDLEAYTDNDYAGVSLDRNSNRRDKCNHLEQGDLLSDLHLEDAEDSQVEGMLKHKEIYVTPSHTKKIFANMKRQGKDFSDEHVTTTSNDPLLSGKDRLKLTELMELYTQLQSRVLALETTKANQPLEIRSLKRKVKKLEKKASKKTNKLKRLYKIGVALVDETQGRNDNYMFDTSILDDEEVVTEKEVSTAGPVPIAVEVVTTAGVEVSTATAGEVITTAGVDTSKPKAKGIMMQEPSETPTPTPIYSSQQSSKAKDKGKAKIIKPKKPLKRKDQIMIDEEVARNLEAQMQAELEEKERLARQKEKEANIALIKSWDNTQAMMDADYELATRLQEVERGELTIEEKSRLFIKLMDKRKKYFTRLRAENIRKQEDAKRQRIEKENKSAELKRCLEIIPGGDDDVTIEATSLSSKSLTIIDYKIYKERRKIFFKIIRADGCWKVGGSGGGGGGGVVGVVCGDGVDRGVRGVDCGFVCGVVCGGVC